MERVGLTGEHDRDTEIVVLAFKKGAAQRENNTLGQFVIYIKFQVTA